MSASPEQDRLLAAVCRKLIGEWDSLCGDTLEVKGTVTITEAEFDAVWNVTEEIDPDPLLTFLTPEPRGRV